MSDEERGEQPDADVEKGEKPEPEGKDVNPNLVRLWLPSQQDFMLTHRTGNLGRAR